MRMSVLHETNEKDECFLNDIMERLARGWLLGAPCVGKGNAANP